MRSRWKTRRVTSVTLFNLIMHDVELDENPRPLKRQRPNPSSSSSSSSSPPSQPPHLGHLTPLPPPNLLLALPPLLIHPPTHKAHINSISLSQHALRRCLALPESQLDRDVECRAWTALAEIGLRCLAMGMLPGLKKLEEDIEMEVEKALTKAVSIFSLIESILTVLFDLQLLIAQKVCFLFTINTLFANPSLFLASIFTFILPLLDNPLLTALAPPAQLKICASYPPAPYHYLPRPHLRPSTCHLQLPPRACRQLPVFYLLHLISNFTT